MIARTGITFLTGKIQGGFVRPLVGALVDKSLYIQDGTKQGLYLPTQLVRVKAIGSKPRTTIVTALEAGGLLSPLEETLMKEFVKPVADAAMIQMAAMGLARAFGLVFAEGLMSGGVRSALGEVAASQAGKAALLDAAMFGGM
jgi:hypothetical protein